jgi:hypothetical protein
MSFSGGAYPRGSFDTQPPPSRPSFHFGSFMRSCWPPMRSQSPFSLLSPVSHFDCSRIPAVFVHGLEFRSVSPSACFANTPSWACCRQSLCCLQLQSQGACQRARAFSGVGLGFSRWRCLRGLSPCSSLRLQV